VQFPLNAESVSVHCYKAWKFWYENGMQEYFRWHSNPSYQM